MSGKRVEFLCLALLALIMGWILACSDPESEVANGPSSEPTPQILVREVVVTATHNPQILVEEVVVVTATP